MAAPPLSRSADENGASIRVYKRVRAKGACRTIGTAADAHRACRLAAGESGFFAHKYRPHSGLRAANRLGCAAVAPVPFDRRRLVRGKSRGMPCLTGESRPRRLLGLRARVV